jgi:hypothetical protein
MIALRQEGKSPLTKGAKAVGLGGCRSGLTQNTQVFAAWKELDSRFRWNDVLSF